MIFVGAIVGGFGIQSILKMRADTASAETAMATVTSFEVTKPTTGGGWSRYPVVAFTTQAGQPIEAKARTSSDAKIGTTLRVLYLPDQPDRPQLPDETAFWLVPWSAAIIGILAFVLGALLWLRGGRAFGVLPNQS